MKQPIILLLTILLIAITWLLPLTARANPTSCPSYPTSEDAYWRVDGQPAGELTAVTYYEGTQSVHCYYRNTSGLILGFLSSKFTVTGLVGTDWIRITPCPMERPCYTCEKRSETSCHFRS